MDLRRCIIYPQSDCPYMISGLAAQVKVWGPAGGRIGPCSDKFCGVRVRLPLFVDASALPAIRTDLFPVLQHPGGQAAVP